eukprot:scaffold4282_cov112-Cylindrotheca_fusiformis.AAC.10
MSIARDPPNPMDHDCDRYCLSDSAAFTFVSMTNGNTSESICPYDPWDPMHGRGSNGECLEKLAAFGIPRGTLPIQSDGTVLLDEHQNWMNRRRQLDAEKLLKRQSFKVDAFQGKPKSAQSSPTIQPLSIESQSKFINPQIDGSLAASPGDILFGRGRKVRDHPGNARFLQLIDHYMTKYEKAGRVDKACIAEIIVRMIKDAGCRFLKKDQNDAWGEVDDSEARKKVAHAFRNRRKLHGYG